MTKKVEKAPIQIEEIARHRNGVCGAPFSVVTFSARSADGATSTPMVGIVFDAPGNVAVFDRRLLGDGVIAFGVNSWRGDHFEPDLRRAARRPGRAKRARRA
jgi:hypothetical protein